ncbi:hypothetical protein FPHYL_11754 [Fusarium phyllophilum]|uniref:Uncharacterized protein n=1 Tax=Fusarium phyllophilum TaxID=47803 RepID=A0A8H5IRP1_9HYPO|nr:hypothetical protein FPHYL_11754 [Fusarium phyllophilum]
MTTKEAHDIVVQLQLLEFPYAFEKARKVALLKAGGIPTMSKLFAVTGQNNKRNAGKRAIDTQVLLREAQTQLRDSDRYATAVARMNYLHARYRRANKITDLDLLHTLGDGLGEISKVIQKEEWRQLTDAEKCAIGVFHKNLGDDIKIPFGPLPSSKEGWSSGLEFFEELDAWTHKYEQEVARPTATNDRYVRVYVDSAVSKLSGLATVTIRKVLAESLDDIMRASLCLEPPGLLLSAIIKAIRIFRITYLRYMALPRSRPIKLVAEQPNPGTTHFNFDQLSFQPWSFGGKVPSWSKEKYQPLKLPLPGKLFPNGDCLLIYGGSTATSALAILFAKLSYLKVLVTASPKNLDYLRNYASTRTGIWAMFSTEDTARKAVFVLKAGGSYSALRYLPKDVVTWISARASFSVTLAYTSIGEAFQLGSYRFPGMPEYAAFARDFWILAEEAEQLLVEGKIKVHRPQANAQGS